MGGYRFDYEDKLLRSKLARYSGASPEKFVSLSSSSVQQAARFSASRNKIWGGETLRLSPVHFRATRLAYTLEALKEVKGKVLDMGCGVGDFCEAINFYRPDLEVYGIDISKKAIEVAKTRVKNAKFEVSDAQKLPFKDSFFDAVLCFDLIEHIQFPQKALKEAYRVLKPGGIFQGHIPIEDNIFTLEGILTKLGWKGKEIYGGHLHHFTKLQVKKMLEENNFRILKTRWGDHFFLQFLEIGYFSILSLRGKNAEHTVEGYLGLAKPTFKVKLLKIIKNILAIISNSESKIFWWYPGIGMHITAIK